MVDAVEFLVLKMHAAKILLRLFADSAFTY